MPSRTEQEKMLAGETYNCLDPDLDLVRQRTKQLVRRYNLAETMLERREIVQQLFGSIGEGSIIEPPFYCTYGSNTHIGDYSYLNFACTILDNNEVRIGDHVMIGPAVQFYTAAHPVEAMSRIAGWEVALPIVVGDNAWIGGGAILLPGVSVGHNAVVGAGAVVSTDVPPDTVAVGNPARVIRVIDQEGFSGRSSEPSGQR